MLDQSKSSKQNNNHLIGDLSSFMGRYSARRILAITIGGIVLAEVFAMVFVYFVQGWSYFLQVLLDLTIMTAVIFPILYLFTYKPLLQAIQQESHIERIASARLRLMQYASSHTLDELLQFILDEAETLTGGTIGFLHYLEGDQKTISLRAWSSNTLQNMCKAEGKGSHYDIEQAGVWADAVRLRKPVVHNDYAELSHRKGLPEGHAEITREMVVPTLRDGKVVAILGVGNKPQDFTTNDLELVTKLADFAWDVIERKRAEYDIQQSEEKFRTLVDWTYDWEKWLNPDGKLVYCSPSCERITGYNADEFITDPDLLRHIVHPEDRPMYEEHHQIVHDETAGPSSIEYRIISRDGHEHWIEHVCRPLFGPDNLYLGRRISNRDISERKEHERKINEQHEKELMLTQTIQTIQVDIARDLHDTLGQNISFLRMNLAYLLENQMSDPAIINGQLQHMVKAADEAYELIREMLAILKTGNPTDPLSLLERYADQVAVRSSIQIDITTQGEVKQLLPHQVRQLFFIFREALSNIEKYAQANRVTGEICWEDNQLMLNVVDNGRGFDLEAVPSTGHYGLQFMSERAELLMGSFSIQSKIGEGTKVTVVVPYEFNLAVRPNSSSYD